MPEENVWRAERSAEQSALVRIPVVLDSAANLDGAAVRGAGVPSTNSREDPGRNRE